VFVCLSEHEGFCVPLLEAMHHRLPIVAFASSAVPETLAGAGVLLPRKDPTTVAAAVHRVVTDPALREALVGRGAERLGDFALHRTRTQMADALETLL
jgi:glycosyltransferase involved in cell wall biosynthesis